MIKDEQLQLFDLDEQLKLFDLPENMNDSAPRSLFPAIHRALWTRHKAQLISRYLYYFVLITKHGVYIDGFAGPQNANQPESWAAKLVLENEPRWMRNFFLCDVRADQASTLQNLHAAQPNTPGRTIETVCADFNSHVDSVLETDKIRENTATFCLLDQRTFECDWATVKKIACRKTERKIEIFYFVPTGWLARSICALTDPKPTMDRWWGRDDWARLREMKNIDIVDAFRQRFLEELGYAHAHGWPIYDHQGSQRIMYHMVHATDHIEAPNLMSRAYRTATNRAEPQEQFAIEFERWAETHGHTIPVGLQPD